VTEYASAACPHCAKFAIDVFPTFKTKYIDTGKVHFTFREVLTPPVPVAAAGFLIARCAGPGKYFATLDGVFRSQKEWYEGKDVRASLLKVAQSQGLSELQFNACVSNEAALKALNERVEKYTTKDNVDSTPTFFINGKRLEGEHTLADLDKAIQPALATKRR
jgi:protein-disulfide isomerase